jgi:peptidoglycan/LPS O-acetylase OafA/YrhL
MYVYLLHTFVLYPLRQSGVLDGERPLWYILLAVVLSFGLTVLLSTKPVVKLFKPIVQPNLNWLFQKKVF